MSPIIEFTTTKIPKNELSLYQVLCMQEQIVELLKRSMITVASKTHPSKRTKKFTAKRNNNGDIYRTVSKQSRYYP